MSSSRPFLFVSVGQPNGRPSSSGQKNVRSWVTKAQHDHRRRLEKAALDNGVSRDEDEYPDASTISASPLSITANALSEPGMQSPRPNKVRKRLADKPTKSSRAAPRPIQQAPAEHQDVAPDRQFGLVPANSKVATQHEETQTGMISTANGSWDAETADPQLCSALDDPADMLSVYASQLETDPRTLWAHYLWQEHEHGSMFRTHYTHFDGIAASTLHPLILSDPAMLATTVLFTACHLRYQRGLLVLSPELLRIHSTTYRFVQAAIDRPFDQLSNATLLAVIKLALFEFIFGYRTAFDTHMQGIARMVQLRSRSRPRNEGIDDYTAHILVWFDANLSAAAGTPRYLGNKSSLAMVRSPFVDTERFMLGVR